MFPAWVAELTGQLAEEDRMPADPIDVVLKFEELINSRDPAAIIGLVTADSVFVDSLGNQVQGLEKLHAGRRPLRGARQ